MNYDIIGDIHGHLDKLHALLRVLGYRERQGTWRHPDRQVIFVGDFIDRGPQQVETVATARHMIDAGSALAVMGNHEFNAIAWYLPDRLNDGEYLRPHFKPGIGAKNRKQHEAFLAEVEGKPIHREIIDWFLTLPLWIDLPGLRVVHACWHNDHIATLGPQLHNLTLNEALVGAASRKHEPEFYAVETLTKGLETALPDGAMFYDKDGFERRSVRVRWWDQQATSYRTAAIWDELSREALPDIELPSDMRMDYAGDKPVFFGHYWMNGRPRLESRKAACVDYSAGKGGALVAYRWEGESDLESGHFVDHIGRWGGESQ